MLATTVSLASPTAARDAPTWAVTHMTNTASAQTTNSEMPSAPSLASRKAVAEPPEHTRTLRLCNAACAAKCVCLDDDKARPKKKQRKSMQIFERARY